MANTWEGIVSEATCISTSPSILDQHPVDHHGFLNQFIPIRTTSSDHTIEEQHSSEFLQNYRIIDTIIPNTIYECREYTIDERTKLELGNLSDKETIVGDLCQPRLVAKKAKIGTKEEASLETEISTLAKLKCPQIIAIVGVERYQDNLYMLTAKYRYDLFSYLYDTREHTLDYSSILKIMRRILIAVNHIHSNRYIHRDIKIENVFLNSPDDAVLADFGSSIDFDSYRTPKNYGLAGTLSTSSPEMLSGCQYCELTDIWSCGMLALELFAYNTSFTLGEFNLPLRRLYDIIQRFSIRPDEFPQDIKDFQGSAKTSGFNRGCFGVPTVIRNLVLPADIEYFLTKMLVFDWQHRLDAQQLLKLPVFFKELGSGRYKWIKNQRRFRRRMAFSI
ncbi:serine/threonine protein kinase [Psittacid alphaherpesvirus 5]|uniref:Serine/threonine protein kinase n=1 Tax=Psittacid alphaherpesvirus 5 TaxID=2972693 RepID=A0A5P9JTS0_9ALPH|nr:serine/threonine protein kinase [Psittacid alphaherpesvirus 5]QFU14625.1 serine/threonine protein kinase [Psittacid alphaherpesvirus 5]